MTFDPRAPGGGPRAYEFRWHQSDRERGRYEFQRESQVEWEVEVELAEPRQVFTLQGPPGELQVLRERKKGLLQGYFQNILDFLVRQGRGWGRVATAYHRLNVAPFLPATDRVWALYLAGERRPAAYAEGVGIGQLKFRDGRGREMGKAAYPRLDFPEAPGGAVEAFCVVLYVVYVREKQFGVGR